MKPGSQPKPLNNIDPNTTTLNQWYEEYARQRGTDVSKPRDEIKKIIAKVTNEDYLDKPLIELLDLWKEKNPLGIQLEDLHQQGLKELAIDEEAGMIITKDMRDKVRISQKQAAYSAINNLSAQLKLSFEQYDIKGESDLTKGVAKPVGKDVKIDKYNFRPELAGHRLAAMMDFVQNNPQYADAFRAADMQQHIGMRNEELLQMSPYDLKPATGIKGGEVPFIFMDRGFTKMSKDIDVPANPRVFALFQQQLAMLEKEGLLDGHLPYLWVTPAPDIYYDYKGTLTAEQKDEIKAKNPNAKFKKTNDPNLKGMSGFQRISSEDLNILNKNAIVQVTTSTGEQLGIVEDVRYGKDNPKRELFTLTEPREVRHLLTMIHDALNIAAEKSGEMLSRVMSNTANTMFKVYGGAGAGKASGSHPKSGLIDYKRTSDYIMNSLTELLDANIDTSKIQITDNVDLVKVALGQAKIPTTNILEITTPDGRTVPITEVSYKNQVYYRRNMKGNKIIGHIRSNASTGESINLKYNQPIDKSSGLKKVEDVWQDDGKGKTLTETTVEQKKPLSAEELSAKRKNLFKGKSKYILPFSFAPIADKIGSMAYQVFDAGAGVAVAAGKVAGATGVPILEGIGVAASAYEVSRLKNIPPEQFVGGEKAKNLRLLGEGTGVIPYANPLPSLTAAAKYPTIEEQEKKDYWETQSKEGFIDAREMLRIRNQPVQSEEEQSFLSEGQQQLN